MKISVIGYSGAGKSTLAKNLSTLYKIPILYLDTVNFEPGWKERSLEKKQEMVNEFLNENKSWVIDGNYSSLLLKRRLDESDMIIFLNFNRFRSFYRVMKRYFAYRGKTRESIAEGCNEKIDLEFINWVLFTGRTKKRKEKYNYITDTYKNKTVILKNQREINKFTSGLKSNH